MAALLTFRLDEHTFALPLEQAERAVRAVAVTPLPQAPAIVRGVVNVGGRIVPIIDLRRRFGLPEHDIEPADQLLFARTASRPLAMIVDEVLGVITCEEKNFVPIDGIVAGTGYLRGIAKSPRGMILIHDLDTFLSLEEEQALDHAVAASGDRP